MKKRMIFGALALALIAGGVRAEVILHGPQTAAEEVVAAEKFYSDRFGEVGIAKGMREFIDQKDGLAFTGAGDPARGAAVYAAFGGDAPSALKLSWTPAEVFVAKSGDMAASWGRFLIVGDPKLKPVHGRYVTVWRKAGDGKWTAIMDIGNPDS
jgi:hypothetical protein